MNTRKLLAIIIALMTCGTVRAGRYTGAVVCFDEGVMVEMAAVSFYRNDTVYVGGGLCDENGVFDIKVSKPANRVTVSCLGYKPFDITLDTELPYGELGNIGVTRDNTLDEVTVTGDASVTQMNRTSYYISDDLREGVMATWQMMDRMPAFDIDPVTHQINIKSTRDVLVLVNGRDRGRNYAMNLNPKQIRTITVIENPQGRYAGLQRIIDITLFTDYVGWSSSGQGNFSGSWMTTYNNESGGVNGNITDGRWSLYGGVSGTHNYTPTRDRMSELFDGILETHDEGWNRANTSQRSVGPHLSFDYRFNDRQSITTQIKYGSDHYRQHEFGDIRITDLEADESELSHKESRARYSTDNVTGIVSYIGRFGKAVKLAADVNYNYYNADVTQTLDYTGAESYLNDFTNRRDNVIGNASVEWMPSDRLSLSADNEFESRRYRSYSGASDNEILTSQMYRNSSSLSVAWLPLDNLLLMATLYGNYIHDSNNSYTDSRYNISPRGAFKWTFDKRREFYLMGSYQYSNSYPDVMALSPEIVYTGLLTARTGNPEAPNQSNHSADMELCLGRYITLTAGYKASINELRYIMSHPEKYLYLNTPYAARNTMYSVGANGSYRLPASLKLSFDAGYARSTVRQSGVSRSFDMYAGSLNLRYSPRDWLYLMLCYDISRYKALGYASEDLVVNDDVTIILGTMLFGGRLSANIAARIPTGVFTRCPASLTYYDFYHSDSMADRYWNSNRLVLNISYNIGNGRSRQQGARSRVRSERVL